MSISQKFAQSATVTVSMLAGVLVLGSVGGAIAGPVRVQGTVQSQPARPSGPANFQVAMSLVGTWEGNMHYQGDDVLTHLVLQVPGGGAAGVWKHIGSKQVNGQWVDTVLKQGPLTTTVQGSQVKLKLNGFYGNSPELEGAFQNGGQKIIGHATATPSLVFSFSK